MTTKTQTSIVFFSSTSGILTIQDVKLLRLEGIIPHVIHLPSAIFFGAPPTDITMTKRKHEEVSSKSPRTKKHKHDSDFRVVHASTVVSIPPIFASNAREGALEMLDSMIMRWVRFFHKSLSSITPCLCTYNRYIPSLEGVVLTHSNLRFLQSTALILYDSPYAKCKVAFDAAVWSPRVGQRLSELFQTSPPLSFSLVIISWEGNSLFTGPHLPSYSSNIQRLNTATSYTN